MKCPKCKEMMQLLEMFTSINYESRLFFYCNTCDKATTTSIEFMEEKGDKK